MSRKWKQILYLAADDTEQVNQLKCSNCAKQKLDYLYIGEEESRIGYLQVWCTECKKGSYVSRVQAPPGCKFRSFDDESLLPAFEIE